MWEFEPKMTMTARAHTVLALGYVPMIIQLSETKVVRSNKGRDITFCQTSGSDPLLVIQ